MGYHNNPLLKKDAIKMDQRHYPVPVVASRLYARAGSP